MEATTSLLEGSITPKKSTRLNSVVARSVIAVMLVGCADQPMNVLSPDRASRLFLIDESIPADLPAPQMRWVTLSRQVPGFGGFWLDPEGHPHAYLLDLQDSARLREAASAVLRENNIDFSTMYVQQGRYDFRELLAWLRSVRHDLASMPGYQGRAINHKLNTIHIAVASEDAAASAVQLAAKFGIPRDAIDVRVELPGRLATTLKDSVHPRVGGLRIQNAYLSNYCILGVNVSDGTQFITASHCTTVIGPDGGLTTHMGQSKVGLGGNDIGTEVTDPYWQGSAVYECCDWSQPRCRYSDAALFDYAEGFAPDSAGQGLIAKTSRDAHGNYNAGSDTISGQFEIKNLMSAVTGSTVHKVGMNSGWTYGTVEFDCGFWPIGGYMVLCDVEVTSTFSNDGDSGAPTFVRINGTDSVRWAGILYAVSSTTFWYSHASKVMDDLGWTSYVKP